MTNKELIPPRDCGITLRPNERIMMTLEVGADYARQKVALRQIRGNIIAYSLDIEFAVDIAIREILFSIKDSVNGAFSQNIEKNKILFDRIISKSGAVTFNNKIRVLKTLLLESLILCDTDRKRLFKLLHEVKSIRNKFAHTTIAFEPRTDSEKTQLTPYIVDVGVRVYLDNNYFDKFNELFAECLVRVENITRTVQKTPLEPLPDAFLVEDSFEEQVD